MTPARITEIVAAAKAGGASSVEIKPDGSVAVEFKQDDGVVSRTGIEYVDGAFKRVGPVELTPSPFVTHVLPGDYVWPLDAPLVQPWTNVCGGETLNVLGGDHDEG